MKKKVCIGIVVMAAMAATAMMTATVMADDFKIGICTLCR